MKTSTAHRTSSAGAILCAAPVLALHAGDYKLLAQPDGTQMELYDLRADPQERTDLMAAEPEHAAEVAAELWPQLQAWKAELP